jgi:hypothetical protein
MISAYNPTVGMNSIKTERLSIQSIFSTSISLHSHAQPGASTLTNRPFAIDIPLPLLLILLPPVEPIPNPLISLSNPQDLSEYRDCGNCPPDLLADDDDETCEIESAGETVSLSHASSSRLLTSPTYLKEDPGPDLDPEDPVNTESLLPSPASLRPLLAKKEPPEKGGTSPSLNPDHPLPLLPVLPHPLTLNSLLTLLPFPSKGAQSHSSLTSSL